MSALLGLSSIEILALIAITFVAGLVRGVSGFALSAMVMASAVLILPIVLLIDQPWTLATPSQASIWSVLLFRVLPLFGDCVVPRTLMLPLPVL